MESRTRKHPPGEAASITAWSADRLACCRGARQLLRRLLMTQLRYDTCSRAMGLLSPRTVYVPWHTQRGTARSLNLPRLTVGAGTDVPLEQTLVGAGGAYRKWLTKPVAASAATSTCLVVFCVELLRPALFTSHSLCGCRDVSFESYGTASTGRGWELLACGPCVGWSRPWTARGAASACALTTLMAPSSGTPYDGTHVLVHTRCAYLHVWQVGRACASCERLACNSGVLLVAPLHQRSPCRVAGLTVKVLTATTGSRRNRVPTASACRALWCGSCRAILTCNFLIY